MTGVLRLGEPILLFADADACGRWMTTAPLDAGGVWLRFAKKGSDMVTLSKAEAIDIALCHGWIDGQQHPFDGASWLTRFTPRRPRSRWSQINRTRALTLIDLGRMRPQGMAEIDAARADGRWDAAYAPASTAEVPGDLQTRLDATPGAATAFDSLCRADRYAALYRLATVKRAQTREARIAALVAALVLRSPD